jgi:hypothetical protein
MMTATTATKEKSSARGESRIPRALLEADIPTLQAALEHKRKDEIQSVLGQIRQIDAQRAELNAKLIGLGYRANGSMPTVRISKSRGRGKRSDLADGMAETILTEALQGSPGERPGFYYEKILTAGGNMGQARRILAALVQSGKVKVEGNKPHTRYSLA